MNISVKKATLADTNFLKDILTAAVKYKLDQKDTSWGTEAYSEREVRGLIKTNDTYVVRVNNDIVGTFGLGGEDERIWGKQVSNAGYMHQLAIRDDLHGQKLGQQIIQWMIGEVGRRGCQYLRLDCSSSNTRLCAYYERLGFKQVKQRLIAPYNYTAALYERKV